MKDLIRHIQANINRYPEEIIIVDQEESNSFTYRSFDELGVARCEIQKAWGMEMI